MDEERICQKLELFSISIDLTLFKLDFNLSVRVNLAEHNTDV